MSTEFKPYPWQNDITALVSNHAIYPKYNWIAQSGAGKTTIFNHISAQYAHEQIHKDGADVSVLDVNGVPSILIDIAEARTFAWDAPPNYDNVWILADHMPDYYHRDNGDFALWTTVSGRIVRLHISYEGPLSLDSAYHSIK